VFFNLRALFVEDGIFESLTAIAFFSSSFFILKSILLLRKKSTIWNKNEYKIIFIALVSIGIIFLFIALEEISWGQRIFGLETPSRLSQLNLQNELNIHNIFTPVFREVYFSIGVLILLIMIIAPLIDRILCSSFYHHVFPHPDLIVLAYFIAFTSFIGAGELFEEMASLFSLIYSIRVFKLFRFTSDKLLVSVNNI